jgi:selenocysteine-specific elongation factor
MRVIGTAGHVDHGKSSLVQAITGINPDRLKEEIARQMTIDLGFAWFTLPGGEEVGIIDVPGHRDFIENMLAGVGGIDAAIFVIAADEGVMPQTREHLSIIDLLQINTGVIAITKIDLVESEWLDLVEEDVQQLFSATSLRNAPIVRLSAKTGKGIPDLVEAIETSLFASPSRLDLHRPRLPIDRVFTITGFGSVVTGTLSDGTFRVGDEIELSPAGYRGRIRGIQTHKHKAEFAVPGSRTAINLTGINHDQIARGMVIIHPKSYPSTRRVDVSYHHLSDTNLAIKHNTEVKFFIGTSEILARVRVLGSEEILPGHTGWLQLELAEPVLAVRQDRYILRRPSPAETIGGGEIIDPHPTSRHKRFSVEVIDRLEAMAEGTPGDLLLAAANALQVATIKELFQRTHLDQDSGVPAAQELIESGLLINLDATGDQFGFEHICISLGFWERLREFTINEVTTYHRSYPLRSGMPREELKSKIKISPAWSGRFFTLFIRKLVNSGDLEEFGAFIRLPGFSIQYTAQQETKIETLLQQFTESPYAPPSVKECQDALGIDLYQAIIDSRVLIQVSPEVVFRQQDMQILQAEVTRMILTNGSISVAQFRDRFNTSRKYALAYLEYLDDTGITLRREDIRVLKKQDSVA